MSATPQPTAHPSVLELVRARWPSVLGLTMILASSFRGTDVYVVTLVTMIAALCYLAAAATSRRGAAWITFGLSSILVPFGIITRLDLTIPIVLVAVLVVVAGVIIVEGDGWRELAIQAAGFAGFTGISVIALNLDPGSAALVAGFAVMGHGVWDVVHHRRDRVVPRSFAEFCAVLDFGIGILLLFVTWVTWF